MSEINKNMKTIEDIKIETFTGVQVIGYAMRTYRELVETKKHNLPTNYNDELFGKYMIDVMRLHKPESVEEKAQKVFTDCEDKNIHKSND